MPLETVELNDSFSINHTLAYSLIALQEMNMVYRYPSIFWNTACLIVESKGISDLDNWIEEFETSIFEEEEIDFNLEEDGKGEGEEKEDGRKATAVNYGKISSAIGKMKESNIKVDLPDINKSEYTFTPDVVEDKILFGIKGITKINTNIANEIIKNRPYSSLFDFMVKVKLGKLPMINLIKSGSFDNIEKKPRKEILFNYFEEIVDKKEKLTLQNVKMLYERDLIPKELTKERKFFFFHKHLLKNKKDGVMYLNKDAMKFFCEHFNADAIKFIDGKGTIAESEWGKLYKPVIEPLRKRLREDENILKKLNECLFAEIVEKYGEGDVFKWEMDSVSFYHSGHELELVNNSYYEIVNFNELPKEPKIDRYIYIKGKTIPLFELNRIAGTVLEKNKLKNLIIVSTVFGVVEIKIWKAQFSKYDKQVFKKLPNGKKKILEKSWFSRGNKLLITGVRRDDVFLPKIYKSSKYSKPIELITEVNSEGGIKTRSERLK